MSLLNQHRNILIQPAMSHAHDAGSYRAIVLDFEGTIADTHAGAVRCLAEVLRDRGRPIPADGEIGQHLASSLVVALSALGAPSHETDDWIHCYRKVAGRYGAAWTPLFPGVAQGLAGLRQAGVKIAIVSTKGRAAVADFFAAHDLSAAQIRVHAGDSTAWVKPDPRLIRDAILPTWPGLAAQDVLLVGDTEVDLALARHAGIACAWAAYGYGDPTACGNLRPDHTLRTFADILQVIGPQSTEDVVAQGK
jgi:phosphoglycolate phosphatase